MDKIKECETALSGILSGLTWRLQPLDISIKKVFRESLRNKHAAYWIDKNNRKGSKSTTIEWIVELWNLDFVIILNYI